MADDDTVLDNARAGRYTRDDAAMQREQPEFQADFAVVATGSKREVNHDQAFGRAARPGSIHGFEGQPPWVVSSVREHPLVHAWRHSANMWRDRFHRQEQLASAWKWVAIGLAIGYPLGICAYRLLP